MSTNDEFNPLTEEELQAQRDEEELRRRIRNEVLRVQSGEADEDIERDREAEAEERKEQEQKQAHERKRRSKLSWQIFSGSILTSRSLADNYRYFIAIAVMCFVSIVVMFAALYADLLSHNISVVAANKIAASSDYATYSNLKHIARQRNIKYLFETNVGAGLPVINTINDLINSGDKILKIEAVLSGTLNFIFNVLSKDVPMSEAVRLAKEKGYSEPDPRIDLCGKDVIRKLVILAREAGYTIEQEEVEANLFIPNELFEGSLENFWERLPELNEKFEEERKVLEQEDMHWRFIAKLENGKGSVSLCKVDNKHPFYNLEGSNNIIMLNTERYKEYPMLIKGYGAGAGVTAAGVFADIMRIANI